MTQHKKPAFRKMKVTGPRSAQLVLDADMGENPTVKAIAETNSDIAKALARGVGAAKSKSKSTKLVTRRGKVLKKPIGATTAIAIHNHCLQRLRALKSQFDQSYNPLLRLLTQQPHTTLAPTGEPQAAPIKAMNDASAASPAMMERVLTVLPKQYQAKYKQLATYLADSPDVIHVTANGRPIIKGREMHEASYVDAMRALYVWRRRDPLPPGTREIIRTLQGVGVPSTLLSSTAAREAYDAMLAAEEDDPEDEYGSPSEDPTTESGMVPSTSGLSTKKPQSGMGAVPAKKVKVDNRPVLYVYNMRHLVSKKKKKPKKYPEPLFLYKMD
jgi:hypothetical protein